MDGTNGSTVFTDLSLAANIVTAHGSAQVDTSDPKFGTGALNATGVDGALTTPTTSGAPLDLSQYSSWTIEGWCNTPTTGGADFLVIGTYGTSGFYCERIGGELSFSFFGTGIPSAPITSLPETLNASVWNHFALVNNAGALTVYINGVAGSTPGTITGALTPMVGQFIIGGGEGSPETGEYDEIRITGGIARYTSNFTPPTAAFPTVSCAPVTVPNVVGLLDGPAQAAIVAVGLTVGTVTAAPSLAPPGTVLSQNPVGGTSIALPASVDLTESEGTTVPNIVNTSIATAVAVLGAAGFVLGAQTVAPSGVVIAGNIISQSPAAGSFAAAGSGVNVVVSGGLPQLTVPDLFGLSQSEAITALLMAGLVPGAIGSAPSQFVPAGEVMAQNPGAGAAVAVGAIVSFVLSIGEPAVGTLFDIEATVISQYANSPTILQLVNNLNQYVDQSTNFANFFNFVWNVDTAVGFGLDIWGVIVNVSRLLRIPTSTDYVGFDNSATPPPDWETMGSDQPPQPAVGGAMYTGYNATEAYLLPDDAYRQLILAKAFANICTTTAPAINQILQNLYGPGTAFVLNTGPMSISYNLTFTPSAIQLAILQQSGVIPTPPGVSFVINTDV